MSAAIELQGLTKRFDTVTAVDNLELAIRTGEMFGLVGPDGAGKTTTIRLLTGILLPTSGTASILGLDLLQQSHLIKRRIGYLSQRFTLYGDLTVDENIEFFAEINEVYDYRERREDLLAFTRLMPFRKRLADQLSGGMKQKLSLACTLIHRPQILFLDEPTTGVDPVSRRDFWKILHRLLGEGITIVMSTPYLDEAERCGRVALMNRGRAMVVDTPHQIRKLMHGEVVEIVVVQVRRASEILHTLAPVRDVQSFGDRLNVVVEDGHRDQPALLEALRSEGIEIAESRIIKPSLENVFISLITERDAENGTGRL